ncbi:MAG: phosphogluconate dehydratase, partial [Variovorax sp.]
MFAPLHPRIAEVTERIRTRSAASRADYLARLEAQKGADTVRSQHSCTNLAHGFAAAGADKEALKRKPWPNIGIVSAYNDMLSAHQPYEHYPALIKRAARESGAVAQFAGGVPAMCDGVTQGTSGMELSLWSRDVIAMSTAVALSHAMFDSALLLGICDKIVPGLFIAGMAFGHLPIVFVPGGPMTSGISNSEKARIRNLYTEGKASREDLLQSESDSYHGAGTCTFYGTA